MLASNSPSLLRLLGVVPLTAHFDSDEACIRHLTHLPAEDLLHVNLRTESPYMSGLYVAVVHETRELLVVFRGTTNAHDLLTDLHCSTASFVCAHARSSSSRVRARTSGNGNEGVTASAPRSSDGVEAQSRLPTEVPVSSEQPEQGAHLARPGQSSDEQIEDSGTNADAAIEVLADAGVEAGAEAEVGAEAETDADAEAVEVHEGFLRTVLSLDQTLLPIVRRLLAELDATHPPPPTARTSTTTNTTETRPITSTSTSTGTSSSTSAGTGVGGYRVTCLGYSFGAAVAGLLALHWAEEFPTITAVTYGPPCVAPLHFARAVGRRVVGTAVAVGRRVVGTAVGGGDSGTVDDDGAEGAAHPEGGGGGSAGRGRPRVVSVINGDDLVARLSYPAAADLRDALARLADDPAAMGDIDTALARHRELLQQGADLRRTRDRLLRAYAGEGEEAIVGWELVALKDQIEETALMAQAVVSELTAVYREIITHQQPRPPQLQAQTQSQHGGSSLRSLPRLYPLGQLVYLHTPASTPAGAGGTSAGTGSDASADAGSRADNGSDSGSGDSAGTDPGVGAGASNPVGDAGSSSSGCCQSYLVDQEQFDRIELSWDMVRSHLPNAYMLSIEGCC